MKTFLLVLILFSAPARAFSTAGFSPGLHEIKRGSGRETVVLIPGVNERGDTWENVLPLLGSRTVYYLSWRTSSQQAVEKQFTAALKSLRGPVVVLAHSAGGVFLYGALSRHPLLAQRMDSHIIAAPLGGYGFDAAVILTPFSPFIAYFGSRITYPSLPQKTTVYAAMDDPVMLTPSGASCRAARIATGEAQKITYLQSTHCGAVLAVAEKVFAAQQ